MSGFGRDQRQGRKESQFRGFTPLVPFLQDPIMLVCLPAEHMDLSKQAFQWLPLNSLEIALSPGPFCSRHGDKFTALS